MRHLPCYHVRVLHPKICSQHATVRTSKCNHRARLVLFPLQVADEQNVVCQGLLRGEVAQVFWVLRQDNKQKAFFWKMVPCVITKLQMAYSVMQCTDDMNEVFISKSDKFLSVDVYVEPHYTFPQTTTSISEAPAWFTYGAGLVWVSLHIATSCWRRHNKFMYLVVQNRVYYS